MKTWFISLLAFITATGAIADSKLDFSEARSIAIQNAGRKKPLDTFAAESLQSIYGRRTYKDEAGQTREAIDVLLSIWTGREDWRKMKIVLVADAGLRRELELSATEKHFSFETLLGKTQLEDFQKTISAKENREEQLTPVEREAEVIISRLNALNAIGTGYALTIVPDPNNAAGKWASITGALKVLDPTVAASTRAAFDKFSSAYTAGKPDEFSRASKELREQLAEASATTYPALAALQREVHYNQFHPFRWAWILYLVSFFVLLPKKTYRIGFAIFSAGLALNLYGFTLRTWIAGRAPVTNMYESVVWVALGVAVFAFIFELIYKARVYALSAAPLAMLGLILADMLPSVLNPNIGPLPPVLRDNFWLVTHVLSITLGYSAFALAMGLAHIILGAYLFKPRSVDEKSYIHHLLYRSLQIGVLLLAAGTILGGVWANYSWGRFWGWDPKETWALIALLLYIFALHGKIAGWWGNFGMAVAAAVSFNGVLMAWYGVNFVLGKGLHSYGFGGGGVGTISLIVLADLMFVTTAMILQKRRSKSANDLSKKVDASWMKPTETASM